MRLHGSDGCRAVCWGCLTAALTLVALLPGVGCGEAEQGAAPTGGEPADGGTGPTVEATRDALRLARGHYTTVLASVVQGGCVDYATLTDHAGLRRELRLTIEALAAVDPALLSADEALGYWLDLHNSCLLDGLLRQRTLDPASDVSWHAFALLREARCPTTAGLVSPDRIVQGVLRGRPGAGGELEHRRLFPDGRFDPRLHLALHLGASSGPPLAPLPFAGPGLDAALARQAARFLDQPLRGAGPAGISRLFDWYADDFAARGGVAAFVAAQRSPGLPAVDLARRLPFDWRPDQARPGAVTCRLDLGSCQPRGEACNGRDDDCDGTTDEHLDPAAADCPDHGSCAGLQPVCLGAAGWSCPLPADWEQRETRCDGRDNDCDGLVDEELDPASAACPTAGVCAGGGPEPAEPVCRGAAGWSCPTPAGYEQPETSCDGLDNDCNGVVDDLADPPRGVCAPLGVCAGTLAACVGGGWSCSYPSAYEAGVETSCDNLDNDCDGVTDEAIPGCGCTTQERRDCGLDEGWCFPGVQYCWEGQWSECSGLDPRPEECNGWDDDCDGVTDEGVAGCECLPYSGERCGDWTSSCWLGWRSCGPDGRWGECLGGDVPQPESCDGWDNDCDGETDELAELLPPPELVCRRGGVCGVGVAPSCTRGGWTCLYSGDFEPQESRCDGLDNDCDGETDEGLLPALVGLAHPPAWDDEACWTMGDWAGPQGCCPPRFRVARCQAGRAQACCLFEICGDADGRDDDCDGSAQDDECPAGLR